MIDVDLEVGVVPMTEKIGVTGGLGRAHPVGASACLIGVEACLGSYIPPSASSPGSRTFLQSQTYDLLVASVVVRLAVLSTNASSFKVTVSESGRFAVPSK